MSPRQGTVMLDREKMYRDSIRRVFAGETLLLCVLFASPFLFSLLTCRWDVPAVRTVLSGICAAGIVTFLAGFCVSCDRYFRWRYQDGRRHKVVMLWSVFVVAAGLWLMFAQNPARALGGVAAGALLLIYLGQPIMMARRRGWKTLTLGIASGLCTLAGSAAVAVQFVGLRSVYPFVEIVFAALTVLMPLLLAAGRSLRGRFLAGMAEVSYEKLRTPVVNGIWIVTVLLALWWAFMLFCVDVVTLR